MPGPYTLMVPLKLAGGYKDKGTLLADLVAIVNAECRALAAAGADFIQIDEPHHGMYAGTVHDVTRGINEAVSGVTAKIAVHVCFGNLYGRPFSAVRDYRNLFPVLGDLAASQVVLEFANRGLDDGARWQDWPKPPRARRRRHRRQGVQGRDRRGSRRADPRAPASRSRRTSCGSTPTAASGRRRAGS